MHRGALLFFSWGVHFDLFRQDDAISWTPTTALIVTGSAPRRQKQIDRVAWSPRRCSDTNTPTTRARGWTTSQRASLATTCFGAGMAALAIPLSRDGTAAHATVGEHTAPARRHTSAMTCPVAPVLRGAARRSAHSAPRDTLVRAPRAIPRTCQPSGNAVGHLMCHPYRPSRPSHRFFRARLITRRRPRRRPRPRALRPRPPNPRPCRLSPMRRRQRGPLWPPSCWEAPQFLSSSYFSHYSP